MAERTASEQRQRRSDARDRRRAMAAEPFEQLDQAARGSDGDRGHGALKQAMATAAAGAVAAGIAGAAKALHDRRTSEEDQDEETPAHDEPPAEEREAERTEPQAEAEGSEQAPDDENGGGQEPQPESEPEPEAEAGGDESEDGDKRPRGGASTGDAKAVVDGARRELQEVLGREPESVSGIRRSDDGWVVTVEVVEVDRIPDSTDVLSSYEVTLDDERKLVGVEQKRRYLRSQVAEG